MRLVELAVGVGLVVDVQLCLGAVSGSQGLKIDSLDGLFDAPTLVVGLENAICWVLNHLIIAVIRCDTECVEEIFTVLLTCFEV